MTEEIYDVWFDYTRLEEGALRDLREEGSTKEEVDGAISRVREVYERAVSQVPPAQKRDTGGGISSCG